jgi:hypothetical protein
MNARWVWFLGVIAVLLFGGEAVAAPPPAAPAVTLELLVMIPSHHQLAVYEQLEFAQPTANPTVGVLEGYSQLQGINVTAHGDGATTAVVTGTASTVALKYILPWDGTSLLVQERVPVKTDAVVIMVPTSLNLPPVINPVWSASKSQRIPGLPNSPLFRVFSTGNVRAGQSFGASIEAAPRAAPAALPPVGFPVAGRAAELLFGLVVAGGLLLALNWRGLRPLGQDARDQLLARLAVLESQYRRGEVDARTYRQERETLLADAETWWRRRAT